MYKIPDDTLFIGKNLVILPSCDSTNTAAEEWSNKPAYSITRAPTGPGTPEGTVMITHRQDAGRGQRGNSWESEPGKNLTLSIILHPKMSPSESFYLNLAVSLGVHDMLSKLNPGHVAVKWPNDIMINNKKTCGILIENTISSGVVAKSIVGIGLNVNQQHFAVNSATSLRKETGKSYDLNQLLASMLHAVEIRYLQTKTEPPRLRADYLGCMFRRHQQHTFRTGDRIFEGMIEGIDSTGRLQIKTNGELLAFGLKEIAYLD